jgi:hypothetical protein
MLFNDEQRFSKTAVTKDKKLMAYVKSETAVRAFIN